MIYTISQGLTDGTSEQIAGLTFTAKAAAIRTARLFVRTNSDPAVTHVYVDDDTGGCVFHKPVRRAAQ